MNRRIHKRLEGPQRTWLVTFNDMITLLIAFFVLLLSMSSIEATKAKGLADSVWKVLGIKMEQEGKGVIESVIPSLRDADIERERVSKEGKHVSGAFPDKRAVLSKAIETLGGQYIIPIKNGISFSMNEQLIFSSGSAEISKEGYNRLQALGEILQRSDVFARVEGHTDDLPMNASKYPSNWERSWACSVNVVKYWISSGMIAPERLSVAGYADMRPKVVNSNGLNRQLNKRLDIILTFPEK